MPKLIMLSGPSGSGKSTTARKMLTEDGNSIRINRDELRLMSLDKWSPRREEWIKGMEDAIVHEQAKHKTHIIVDDTNLRQGDHDFWKNMAKEIGYDFKVIKINPGLEECLRRDAMRKDHQRVGRAAIERQFLRGKLIEWPTDRKVVIFDIDGTLADLTHRTPWLRTGKPCPGISEGWCFNGVMRNGVLDVDNITYPATIKYDERPCPHCVNGILQKKQHNKFYSLVKHDKPIEAVIKWAQATDKDYYNIIVSGRSPEQCEADTIMWLKSHKIPFNHIFFRMAHQHNDDVWQKQQILTLMIESGLPRDQIAFVVDDRPSVVQMWRDNRIKVYPVRGRDDDEFYELMNDLEKTHPQSIEAGNVTNS